jgi:hypothetical protein
MNRIFIGDNLEVELVLLPQEAYDGLSPVVVLVSRYFYQYGRTGFAL